MKTDPVQIKSWILPKPINKDELINCNLNTTLQKVLIRRGIDIYHELDEFITPSNLPDPEEHFNELSKATKRIIEACNRNEQIAICGDYDADGITSTVLLIELLSKLGARVKPYIPSREYEGYGLNINMINEINKDEIRLIITVDNGISAFNAIKKANEYGIDLIITDHHKIPKHPLNIFSLIHPERTPIDSPYKYLAGVGIAFLLAKNICNKLDYDISNTTAYVFFCIGTVADMAPLKGANRKWLKDYLSRIKSTNNKGIKSIMKKLSIDKADITSEDIGFKIAPLINAVGRIGDPKIIVDLLTNDSTKTVDKLSKECFAMSKERKRLTSLTVDEAIDIAIDEYTSNKKFLVLTNKKWHPGFIGIVAARMVDKFNLPTAILAKASDGDFRGSIRSNKKLKVNHALDECNDLLIAHGGHSDAAGFSIKEENIHKLKDKLDQIAKREFKNINLKKTIKPDAYLSFRNINHHFYKQLTMIGPFGIMNPVPIFWTRKCKILDINVLNGNHLKMKLYDGNTTINAIKWNASIELNKNDLIDIAFYIEINKWKGKKDLILNILDIKMHNDVVDLQVHNHHFKCQITDSNQILIQKSNGTLLSSDLTKSSESLNHKQKQFARKIISFAEIALGKAA